MTWMITPHITVVGNTGVTWGTSSTIKGKKSTIDWKMFSLF